MRWHAWGWVMGMRTTPRRCEAVSGLRLYLSMTKELLDCVYAVTQAAQPSRRWADPRAGPAVAPAAVIGSGRGQAEASTGPLTARNTQWLL